MNYYDILNVSNTASEEDIRAAYIIMVKKYHPDVYIGNKCFAEEQMKLVNEAYDILHNKEKRKKYDISLGYHFESCKDNNRSDLSNKVFSYLSQTITIDFQQIKAAKCKSSIIEAGFDAGRHFIKTYKAKTNWQVIALSCIGFNLGSIGINLLKQSLTSGMQMGLLAIAKHGFSSKEDLEDAKSFLTDYCKNEIDSCIRFYNKSINSTLKILSNNNLSVIAYKIYCIYRYIGRGTIAFLSEKKCFKMPSATIEQVGFALWCENNVREQKILKGDMSVLRPLFEILFTSPERVQSYCLLYYLYGDNFKELEIIAEFFGIKEEYNHYKNEYCNNALRIDESSFFANYVNETDN